jgi:hypothetical protein
LQSLQNAGRDIVAPCEDRGRRSSGAGQERSNGCEARSAVIVAEADQAGIQGKAGLPQCGGKAAKSLFGAKQLLGAANVADTFMTGFDQSAGRLIAALLVLDEDAGDVGAGHILIQHDDIIAA